MKASIVTVGDEILIGQIVDTNSSFIAKALDKIGIETLEMLSISDSASHIQETMASCQDRVDLVVITGGLGPTKDDVTKKTFCAYFKDELVLNSEVLAHVTQLIESSFKKKISQINRDQALVPSACCVLHNDVGTAPGMWMQEGNTVFVSLPGVPFEMKYLVENRLIPKLVQEFERPYILHKTILTYGMGESLVAERLEEWENALPDFVKLAYLPAIGRLNLRLSARGTDRQLLEAAMDRYTASLAAILDDIIIGYDEGETLQLKLGKMMTEKKISLATAESCTGGTIAQLISSVAGASAYFKGSVVAYATQTKVKVLGLSQDLIDKHSVVSAEVAEMMALQVQKMMDADYAIATTGNAGPSKGEADADLGMVYIALATPIGVQVEGFNFGQPREKVVDRAAVKGLEMLLKEISKKEQ